MGIFKEDLLQFGNLIDTEAEVKIPEEDLEKHYKGLEFSITPDLLIISYTKKSFLFSKRQEIRCAPDEREVFNERTGGLTKDFGIYLRVLVGKGIENIETDGIKAEGERLRLSLWNVFRSTDTYHRAPPDFRDKLTIVRYMLRNGYMSLFLTVTK